MSRELIEFSNLIDEQFEPDTTITDELWSMIQTWLAPQHAKKDMLKSEAHAVDANKVAA
jgi:hypothetical protein